MRKSIILLVLFCLCYQFGNASSPDRATSLFIEADAYRGAAKYNEAIALFEQTYVLSSSLDSQEYAIDALIWKSFCYLKLEQWEPMKQQLDLANINLMKLDDDDPSYKQYLKNRLHYYFGKYHLKIWDNESAAYYFEQVIQEDKKGNSVDTTILINTYTDQGIIFRRLGDNDKAITFYDKVLRLDSGHNQEVGQIYQNIARAHLLKGDYPNALIFYKKALAIIDNIKSSSDRTRIIKSLIYRNIGEYYTTVDSLDKAEYYIDSALKIESNSLGTINSYQRKGLLLLKQSRLDSAKSYFEKAIELSTTTFSLRHPETAEALLEMGNIYAQETETEKALEYYQQALISISKTFDSTDPTISPAINDVSSRRLYLQILAAKAKILESLDRKEDAIDGYSLMANLIDTIRLKDIVSDESLFSLIAQSRAIYANGIKLAKSMNREQLSFFFSQKSHGMKLLQGIQNNIARKIGGIPAQLVKQERVLKIEIQDTRAKWLQTTVDSTANRLQDQLFNLQIQYDSLINQLEDKYPKYLAARYDLPTLSVEDIQSQVLNKNSALIEYFIDEDSIYTFVITKNDLTIFSQKKEDTLKSDIEIFKATTRQFNLEKSNYDRFCNASNNLYQTLLKAPLNSLNESINNLIIILDGPLNYISFAALIEELPEGDRVNYYKLSYLIKKYALSYNYSSALLAPSKLTTLIKNNDDHISFAPVFEVDTTNSSSLKNAPLPYSREEVLIIDNIIGSRIYLSESATKKVFENDVGKYWLAHLATHATCNDSIPLNGYIYFHNDSLAVYQVYNLEQNLYLIVLSACDSGDGKLRKGEGIQSMARAFLQAGCESILTSLWTVNDQRTPQLMEYFYYYLVEMGESKNVAIKNAQMDFMADHNESYSHPFYWANFILVGNPSAIYKVSCDCYCCYLLLLLLILVIAGWSYRRNK